MLINDKHSDCSEKLQRCKEYVEALEEERRKILVFQRELPLTLELVSQAIDGCNQQLSNGYFHGQSECSGQTSSEGPVLEEFIPIKRTSSSDDDEQQSHKTHNEGCSYNKDCKANDKYSKKSDWLRSVQLWNQTPDPPTKEDSPKKVSVMEVKRNGTGGAFHPFQREKSVVTTAAAAAVSATVASSTTGTGGIGDDGNKKEDKVEQSQRKARRSWLPELHRRFLEALQQLGGSQVATPKQIRELMKVDGLTNDEVKSHLQKYRLHTMRRSPSSSIRNKNNPQPPQFVVVGGIWVPPPEYAAMTTTTASGEVASGATATSNRIYAPVAMAPKLLLSDHSASPNQWPQNKEFHSNGRGSHSESGARSSSPATSSSTHTSTASPAY